MLGWPELRIAPNTNQYVPRVFGFKVHPSVAGGDMESARIGGARRGGCREGLL